MVEDFENLFLEKNSTYIVLKTLYLSEGKKHASLFNMVYESIKLIPKDLPKSYMNTKYGSYFREAYLNHYSIINENSTSSEHQYNILKEEFCSMEEFLNYNKEKVSKKPYYLKQKDDKK